MGLFVQSLRSLTRSLFVLYDLQRDDPRDDHKADQIRDGARDQQRQSADHRKHAQRPVHGPEDIALQTGGDGENAEKRRNNDLNDLKHACDVLEQHLRVIREDERDDEGRDGELGRINTGLHPDEIRSSESA